MAVNDNRRVVDVVDVRDMLRDVVLDAPDKRAKPFYVVNDEPHCIVAKVFHMLGWPVVEYLAHDPVKQLPHHDAVQNAWTLTPKVGEDLKLWFTASARELLNETQIHQDSGCTWWDAYYLACKTLEVEIEKALILRHTRQSYSTYLNRAVGE